MEPQATLGRALFAIGVALALAGALLWFGPPWLGRLPGDLRIERPGFRAYFPLGTSLVLSLLLTLALYVASRMR